MRQGIVLASLGELEAVRGLFGETGPVPESRALVPVTGAGGSEEVEELVEAAGQALSELRSLLTGDGERRREAEQGLARLRELRGEAAHLRAICSELGEAARRADGLARSAFEPADRGRAREVAAQAGRLRGRAEAHAAALEREAAALAWRGGVARLLAEEQARKEATRMKRELELAGEHLDGGRVSEARRLLDSVGKKISSAPDLEQAFATLRRREHDVKTRAAEAALSEARRLHRREPMRAIELLEAVETDGLPDELARHLYGCWLTACRRLGLLAAIHYRPGFGRGAVLIPSEDGRWEVVSAFGLRRWERGRRFAPRALRGARPLA